ncbi:unnamed protein product [Ectocarpus fasciculatus]
MYMLGHRKHKETKTAPKARVRKASKHGNTVQLGRITMIPTTGGCGDRCGTAHQVFASIRNDQTHTAFSRTKYPEPQQATKKRGRFNENLGILSGYTTNRY